MNNDTRAFAKRIMQKSGGVPPNGVQAAPYSATLHFLTGRFMEAADAECLSIHHQEIGGREWKNRSESSATSILRRRGT